MNEKSYLSRICCEYLQQHGPKDSKSVAKALDENKNAIRTRLASLAFTGCLSAKFSERSKRKEYSFVRMPRTYCNPKPASAGAARKPATTNGSGVIAPRPPAINFCTTLRRDPFEQWRLCQRDPITTTQSAVFSFKR